MTRDKTVQRFMECEAKRKEERDSALKEGRSEEDALEIGHEAARAHWNAWAEELLAKRKALEDAGSWRVKTLNWGGLEPKNAATRTWMAAAKATFSQCAFVFKGGEGTKEAPEEDKDEGEAASLLVKSIGIDGKAVDFRGFVFPGDAEFNGTIFKGDARFERAIFEGHALFVRAVFEGYALFAPAIFKGPAWFGSATFEDTARFDSAHFFKGAKFRGLTFPKDVLFGGARFEGQADFGLVTFERVVQFDGAAFTGEADFDAVWGKRTFSMADANLNEFRTSSRPTLRKLRALTMCRLRNRKDWSF